MRLNDTLIRNTKPAAKPIKLSDGDGLYLLIQPRGSRWWRMKYFFKGTEKMLSVGVYPEVSLKRARQRRAEIREQVANGIDPSAKRKAPISTRRRLLGRGSCTNAVFLGCGDCRSNRIMKNLRVRLVNELFLIDDP